jgi:HlyD family secretion protein
MNQTSASRPRNWRARVLRVGAVAGVVALLATLALWPQTRRVDIAEVKTGLVRETFEAEGRTRVRDRYVITAPMAATVRRIQLEPGDPVTAGQPLVSLEPVATPTLDARTRAQLGAEAAGARAELQAAQAQSESARYAATLARSEAERVKALRDQGMVSLQSLEQAQTLRERSELEARSATFRVSTATHRLEASEALLHPGGPQAGVQAVTVLRAPVNGVVLRRHVQSSRPVQPGEPLLEMGDPGALEVEVDVLSTDAVRLHAGQAVEILRWGGEPALRGEVARVEPTAFTKTSALGVEEQRVWVVIHLLSPHEQWRNLGEAYRVHARFVLREARDSISVPTGALFRLDNANADGHWAVFRVEGGKAQRREVEIGLRGDGQVQVLRGLSVGDLVVLHPPRELSDGDRVTTP